MEIERERGMTATRAIPQEELARLLGATLDDGLAAAAWRLIAEARRILILAHEHPDADALGSALGVAHALAPLGKQCVVACADPVPATYHSFLPGWEGVVTELPDERFDLVLALDAGELSRYGALYTRYQAFFDRATILNMDHHITSTGCGVVNLLDVPSAATAELVTLFLLNRGVAIGLDTARCLLAGIITDTRAFEFDATTQRTLAAGAYLVGCGAVPQDVVKPVYRMKPYAKARLWGEALRSLDSAAGGRVVWATLSARDFAEVGATGEMDDGLASYLVDIDGVAYALLFKEGEKDGVRVTRVSLRTSAPHDAAAVAAHFGGGGHVRAAGATLAMEMPAAIQALTSYVVELLTQAG